MMLMKFVYQGSSSPFYPKREEIVSFLNKQTLHTRQEIIDFYNHLDFDEQCTFISVLNQEVKIFEFITQDFVNHVAEYLAGRVKNYLGSPACVLEVAAGDGLLTHHLQSIFNQKYPDLAVDFIATDSGKDQIEPAFKNTRVHKMDSSKALKIFKPNIVICSWMPYELDLSKTFRNALSVQEYLLFGDPEICGEFRETWGGDYKRGDNPPAFRIEGFKKFRLTKINRQQIGRSDLKDNISSIYSHSRAYSFRRNSL